MGACYSKKAAKAALKKHRMERPTKKGQRSSGNNNNNNNSSKKGGVGHSRAGSSKTSHDQTKEQQQRLLISKQQKDSTDSSNQGSASSGRSIRSGSAMKIGVRDESTKILMRTSNTNLNTSVATNRTRSGSRGSAGSSPAGFHGRGGGGGPPYKKTSIVAPAPSKFTPKANSLNRFGFRSAPTTVKSGDSTDSVNSILSDAQTVSDSNSNILDICDDHNENKNLTVTSDNVECDNSKFHSNLKRESSDTTPKTTTAKPRLSNVPKQSITSFSGVGQSNRITISARQLPKPQVVTVKSVSPKISDTIQCKSPKGNNLNSSVSSLNKSKSPSVRSFNQTPIKRTTEPFSSGKFNSANSTVSRISRVSHDSESSSKSCVEPDSGLGSSSESDKILQGEGETDTLNSTHIESTEDVSDVWLKKTRLQASSTLSCSSPLSKRKSRIGGSMEIQFKGTNSFDIKRQQNLEVNNPNQQQIQKHLGKAEIGGGLKDNNKHSTVSQSPLEKKSDIGKDRRDTTITYGMARQKFAPYSRGRYGYGYQSGQTRTGLSAPSSSYNNSAEKSSSLSLSPGTTKISPKTTGLVRSRIAMIETPESRKTKPMTVLNRSQPKKPLVRPTSLEKTPILVMPVMEKTVDLSKPVCRKLEYSENVVMPLKGESLRDPSSSPPRVTSVGSEKDEFGKESQKDTQPLIEDILIVGSVEVETQKDTNVLLEADHYGSFYDKGIPPSALRDRAESRESQGLKDSCKKEKPILDKLDEKSHEVRKQKASNRGPKVVETSRLPVDVEISDSGEATHKHNSSASVVTPDDSGIKLSSPQSESSFEILESLSETVDLTAEEEEESEQKVQMQSMEKEKDNIQFTSLAENNTSITKPVVLPTTRESSTSSSLAKEQNSSAAVPSSHVKGSVVSAAIICSSSQGEVKSPVRAKSNVMQTTSECLSIRNSNGQMTKMEHSQELSTAKIKGSSSYPLTLPEKKKAQTTSSGSSGPSTPPFQQQQSVDLRCSMEASVESHKSIGIASILTDSGDHSNLSGKCTPTLNTGRSGDLDQDFLIDDEIADQPGLMFGGGSAMTSSFFTDDALFDDIATSPPPSLPVHSQLKQVMGTGNNSSRADSIDTASSVCGDDLMLDYFDMEEVKTEGYEEEVLSPDASQIFSEWTAMMAEVEGSTPAPISLEEDDGCGNSIGSGGCSGREALHHQRQKGSLSELSSSPLDSSCRRPATVFRPPRQGTTSMVMEDGSVSEGGEAGGVSSGGNITVDRTSYHYLCQDVTSLKTLLLRLRRILQAADTINPFDTNLRNSLYLSMAAESGSDSVASPPPGINGDKDLSSSSSSVNKLLTQENLDLKRQVVLLQQQLQERDRTVRLMQQQQQQAVSLHNQQQHAFEEEGGMSTGVAAAAAAAGVKEDNTEMDSSVSGCSNSASSSNMINAATQTERASRSSTLTQRSSLTRTSSIDDGLGPTVSFRLGKQVHVF